MPFTRPAPAAGVLPSFAAEAPDRLARFVPPFRFTSFFSPEDTLLCVLAAEALLGAGTGCVGPGAHVVELTAGSGLVGLRLLDLLPAATLAGIDVDPEAPPVAAANARRLGLGDRARFEHMSVWDDACAELLAARPVDLLVCNPPYIPEPPDAPLAVEAGAGADGAAHLRRLAELAAATRPRTVALSWCSLGDPVGVTRAMEDAGYALDALYAVAIADGEYAGQVHDYLAGLSTAFFAESGEAVRLVAPDGAARFAYLLLAGAWRRRDLAPDGVSAVAAVEALMRDFAARGPAALAGARLPCAYAGWLLDRWDELALRAALHGALPDAERRLPRLPAESDARARDQPAGARG